MSIPIEIGAGAISGGALVGLAIKLLPILLRRFNGRNKGGGNSMKPGYSKICIERGEKIVEHDTAIKHLCELSDKVDKQMETARTENREDHQRIFDKLDEIRK